jgi:hypothetical protein
LFNRIARLFSIIVSQQQSETTSKPDHCAQSTSKISCKGLAGKVADEKQNIKTSSEAFSISSFAHDNIWRVELLEREVHFFRSHGSLSRLSKHYRVGTVSL